MLCTGINVVFVKKKFQLMREEKKLKLPAYIFVLLRVIIISTLYIRLAFFINIIEAM